MKLNNNLTLPPIVDELEAESTPIIKVIGVGGGGSNAINHMFNQNVEGVAYVVCNTDRQALRNSPVPTKLLIGPNVTKGLGAGNDPERARQAAEESKDDIAELFNDNTQMVFITAGMGGGTGTGAAPVVARIAREKGMLTIGIVTIPFLFEGEKKILKALDGADEMSKYVDAMLVINNERLTDIYKDQLFSEAFAHADDTLSTAARSIAELITCEGYINLDFNDVKTTLTEGGVAIISSGYGEGENRVTKAIQDALNSPLLKNRDVEGSKKILFNIYFSRKAQRQFVMGEADELTTFMTQFAPDVDVIWGAAFDDSLGEQVRITLLASGFKVTVRDDTKISGRPGKRQPTQAPTAKNDKDSLVEVYGSDKINERNQQIARARYLILTPEQFDNEEIIDILERNPAYKRDGEKVRQAVAEATAGVNRAEASAAASAGDAPDVIKFGDD